MSKIVFVIPALNEEKNLKNVISKFKKFGKIIVVNDKSKDNTKKISNLYAFKTLNNKKNIGYDKSLRRGISYVLKNLKKTKILITVDADGQHQPGNLKKNLNLLKKNDVIICNRNIYNRKIEKKISNISNKKFNLIDPLTGFKYYRINSIKKYWHLLDKNIDYYGMFCLLWHQKLKIVNSKIFVNKKNKISSMETRNIEKKFYISFKKIVKILDN